MNIPIEYILLGVAILLFLSVIASKTSGKFGVPTLLLFLVIGMLAGSDGPGGIYFNNPWVAQLLGVTALVFILFAGGLETDWKSIHPVLWQGISLSTLGVVLTAALVGWFAKVVLNLSLLEGLLLGSIVSSTDASAIFSVLRSKNVSLRGGLKPLLELESGSNDPMAVFLTISLIKVMTEPSSSVFDFIGMFFLQMGLGAIIGYVMGRAMISSVNRLKLDYEGLYPVLTLSLVLLCYAVTTALKGSGFLAVYVAGMVMAQHNFAHKKSLVRFHDGLAWLMQIAMFLTLGMLVFPSRLVPIAASALIVSMFLIFFARPVSVFAALVLSKVSFREKSFVSWVGLRGAVPIILATFPLLADIPKADTIFNLVFFIVLTSVLLQGTSISLIAKLLKVDSPIKQTSRYPLEFEHQEGMNADLVDFIVPYNSDVANKLIVELNLPKDCLISLICRDEKFIVPSGNTVVEEGDVLLVLANNDSLPQVREILSKMKKTE